MYVMNVVIAILCSFLWIVPFIFMVKPDKNVYMRMFAGVILMATIGYALVVVTNNAFAQLITSNIKNPVWSAIIMNVLIGVREEGIKFVIAFLCVKGMKKPRYVDLVLIYAAVGTSFCIREALAYGATGGMFETAIRSIYAVHIIWLYFQGIGYAEQKVFHKNIMVRNLLIVMFLHGLHDTICAFEYIPGLETVTTVISFMDLVITILFVIYFIRKMLKNMPKKMA